MNPGSDRIRLEGAVNRWRAMFAGHVIADTEDAIVLYEMGYAPVVYFPRQDVAMDYMGRTDHHTRCPFKGEASYYTLRMDIEIAENVAWSYEAPIEAMELIAGRVAFYPDRVEIYQVDDATVNPHRRERIQAQQERERLVPEPPGLARVRREHHDVDDIVQHTDAGNGASQRTHWPANADVPPPEGGVR